MQKARNGGEGDLLRALGYDEAEFLSPVASTQEEPTRSHTIHYFNSKLGSTSNMASTTPESIPRVTEPTSLLAARLSSLDINERFAEQDGPDEEIRILRLALQSARERETITLTACAEAEKNARQAKLEVAELRAEVANCWSKDELLVAELQAARAEASATSECLSAELLALREKSRSQARRDELSLSMMSLECKQFEFELQAAAKRTHLEVLAAKNAMQEEFERERVHLCEQCSQVAAPPSAPPHHAKEFKTDASPREKAPQTTPVSECPSLCDAIPDFDMEESSASGSDSSKLGNPESERHKNPSAPHSPSRPSGTNSRRPPLAPNSPTRTSRVSTSESPRDSAARGLNATDEKSTTAKQSSSCQQQEKRVKAGGGAEIERDDSRQKGHNREGKNNEMLGRDLFRKAEALCAQHRHAEAIPIFEETLQVLRDRSNDSMDRRALVVAQADVWAHLGVSMQSLDRMHEALASYGRAVALNPQLHACFANLATLHLYLRNTETARRHIGRALAVKPGEEAYLDIQREVEDQARRSSRAPEVSTGSVRASVADGSHE